MLKNTATVASCRIAEQQHGSFKNSRRRHYSEDTTHSRKRESEQPTKSVNFTAYTTAELPKKLSHYHEIIKSHRIKARFLLISTRKLA